MVNNLDPLQIRRIQAIVPDVGSPTPRLLGHAMRPDSKDRTWVSSALPMVGSGVWIEFERGDPDYPISVGCWLEHDRRAACVVANRAAGRAGITLQTALKNGVVISDTPGPTGGILIQTTTGAMISVSDVGIVISNGKGAMINMIGPTTDINAAALTVT